MEKNMKKDLSCYHLRLPARVKDAGMAWSETLGMSFRELVQWALVEKLAELEWDKFSRDPRNKELIEAADRHWEELFDDGPGPDDSLH